MQYSSGEVALFCGIHPIISHNSLAALHVEMKITIVCLPVL